MKTPTRTQVDIMHDTVKEAAAATPRMIESEVRIANAKANLWSVLSFLVVVLIMLSLIPLFILAIRLGQCIYGWTP